MFVHAEGPDGVEVRFTDASVDLQGSRPGFAGALAAVEAETGVCFARLSQVHGDVVHTVTVDPGPGPRDDVPVGDGLVTSLRGTGLMVRVADCVPVVLADAAAGVVGVAHAGRVGVRLGVVTRVVERMVGLGARGPSTRAWIGPHVCGACYEVPASMRDDVAAVVPATWSTTRAGTAALDLGAGVRSQLEALDVTVDEVGGCSLTDERLHSHRRDASAAGRMAALVWVA